MGAVKYIADRLRQFDAYPKTLEDFQIKTFSGAAGKFLCMLQEEKWWELDRFEVIMYPT